MCDWMRVVKSGLGAGIVVLAASLLLMPLWNLLFPFLQAEYLNPALFRPWTDPLMSLYFLYPFVLGLAMAYVYEMVMPALKTKGWVAKGARFGFMLWVVAGVPGMLMTYASFPVSLAMVFSWLAGGLAEMLLAGMAVARIWGK